ncbi:hypothetical protein DAPPUDRAFT_317369 [Daphnia pulex]|uniref:Uncharacterized protein n=1 Tax=Daphnia pulex TaxID=6669 RepID=E9GFS2_DAPPU|nr:hypothetical protein DAPPUDRAFT_317369 [Daphnia pulex]|eukprot:EFX81689.1 hypothetical protein DAPPUDRAFT_317369 [Daphnia pulex]
MSSIVSCTCKAVRLISCRNTLRAVDVQVGHGDPFAQLLQKLRIRRKCDGECSPVKGHAAYCQLLCCKSWDPTECVIQMTEDSSQLLTDSIGLARSPTPAWSHGPISHSIF